MSHHSEPSPEDLSTILLPSERELVWLDCAFLFVAALIVIGAIALAVAHA